MDGTVDNWGRLWINRDGPKVVHHPVAVVHRYIPCSSTSDHATRPAQTAVVPTTHNPYYYCGLFFSLKKKEKEKKARWISGQLGSDRQDGVTNSSDPDAEIASHALRWNSREGCPVNFGSSSGRTSRARRSWGIASSSLSSLRGPEAHRPDELLRSSSTHSSPAAEPRLEPKGHP